MSKQTSQKFDLSFEVLIVYYTFIIKLEINLKNIYFFYKSKIVITLSWS